MLLEMEHQVIEAKDGKEALERLKTDPDVGLVLLDWNMPEMDGMDVLNVLRAKEKPAGRPRVVIVSTECDLEKIVQAMKQGADEYIMKPFTKEILEEKLSILGIERG